MLVNDAIEEAAALTGQAVPLSTMLRWLSELDGRLAIEFYHAGEWAPYTQDDLHSELAVPFPWDGGVYVHYLEAQTCFASGEYERFANARARFEAALGDFRRYVQRGKSACGGVPVPLAGEGGTGVTVVGEGQALWRYLSAYGTAVRCGFSGTPEEWLASLVGGDGMREGIYDPDGDVADAGGIPAYLAAAYQTKLLFDDAPTEDSRNPVTSGGVYAAIAGAVKAGTVSLSAVWSGEGPYTQTVAVTGAVVTANSRVDLQPSAAQLAALAADGVTALVVENSGGALTAYALGAAPSASMTVQCSVVEVGV